MSDRHVAFLDLDGTLIDSAGGILTGVRLAFESVDAAVPDNATMRSWIGPPVRETLVRELGALGPEAVQHANAVFRAYFDDVGMHESVVFPGIPSALDGIAADGAMIVVVTHKPMALAEAAIRKHGLDGWVRGIYAPPSPSVAVPKADLFAAAIGDTHPSSAMAAGDRAGDIHAAAAHGVASVGVAWGYGSTAELRAAGARAIARDVGDLPAMLRP